MSYWYQRVTADPEDYTAVAEAVEYFDAQYEIARRALNVDGKRIEEVSRMLPQIIDERWCQYQEIEAIMRYLELRQTSKMAEKRRHYLEHYNRTLNATTAEKYAEGDEEVINLALLRNHVSLVRNKYQSLCKGLEWQHYQVTNITKLRVAGIEDATL